MVARRLAAIFLFLIPAAGTFGQDAELAGREITEITFEGLERTRRHVVLELMMVEVGDQFTVETLESVRRRLSNADIFASAEVRPVAAGNEGVELIVTVDEAWTLVPVPFFATDGGEFTGGLIVIESNLLGFNKQLVGAGFGGTDGFSGFFAYVDPALFGSDWTGRVSAATGLAEEERRLPDESKIRDYEVSRTTGSLGLGYRFSERWEVSGDVEVGRFEIEDESSRPDQEPIEDGVLVEPAVRVEYADTRRVDVLRVGPSGSAAARLSQFGGGADTPGWEIIGRALWGIPLFGTHRARLLASGGYGDVPALTERTISGRDGYRSLPYQTVSADRWGGGAAFYDLPVLSAGWGALVLSHYWEAGAYETESIEPQPFVGTGGAFRVYLRQVAVPALGLDVAYNLFENTWVYSFAIGAQM
jgi:hypothetical protein